jgi:hypothetical protein
MDYKNQSWTTTTKKRAAQLYRKCLRARCTSM